MVGGAWPDLGAARGRGCQGWVAGRPPDGLRGWELASCPTRRCCCRYLSAQQHRVCGQRACGGGRPVREGGLGRERGTVRQQGNSAGAREPASCWAGGVLGTPVSQKSPRAGAQPDMQRVQGGPRDPPPCLGVTLGTGSGGRGREGGSGRAEPRAAGCGERERGDKPCSMRRPPSRRAETETPPSVHSSGAQPWLGRAPIPVSGQVAMPGCPGCQGVGSHTWDALLSWHPRTGMNSAPLAPSTPILTLLPCMTCTSVA